MKSSLVSVVVIVALAAGNIWQFMENRDAKARCEALNAKVTAVSGEVSVAKAQADSARKQVEILKADNELAQQKVEKLTSAVQNATTAEPAKEPEADASMSAQGGKGKNSMFKQLAEMMKNPETRKAMRAQQMIGMRMLYGDLIKQLHVDSSKADQLYEILLDEQMGNSELGMAAVDGKFDTAKSEALRQESAKRLEELLGPAGKKSVQEYQSTMGLRFMVNQFDQQLNSTNDKLSDQQKDGLLQIMADEDRKTPGQVSHGQEMAAATAPGAMEAMVDRQEKMNRNILTRAQSILTPDQYKQLGNALDNWVQMQKSAMTMFQSSK